MKISDLIKKALKHDEDVERIDEQLETNTNNTININTTMGILLENFKRNSDENDDTGRFLRAINKATNDCVPLILGSGKIYNITGSLGMIDISKTSLIGDGTIINVNYCSSYVLQICSSVDYSNFYKNSKTGIKGIIFRGGNATNKLQCTCLLLGHSSYQANAHFFIENVMVEGFKYNLEFTHNVWRLQFINFSSRWGETLIPIGLRNMGENISFTNCAFYDGGADVTIGTGFFHFLHTSFDNCPIVINGDARVYLDNCHIENPGEGSKNIARFIEITSITGTVVINDTDIIFNPPSNGSNYDISLFKIVDTNKYYGFIFNNSRLFQTGEYQPWIKEERALLINGNGRVCFKNFQSVINYNAYAISSYINKISNGNGESSYIGWTLEQLRGTSSSVSMDNTTMKYGTKSVKLQVGEGNNARISQEFYVNPGEYVCSQYFRKTDLTSATSQFQIMFLNSKGENIGQIFDSTTSSSDWANKPYVSLRGYAPIGSVKAKIMIGCDCSGTGSLGNVWIDDMIINVV